MPNLKLASFNLDGLSRDISDGPGAERRVLQALALRATDADVAALQGVESLAALKAFAHGTLAEIGSSYRYQILIDGNDGRTGHPAVIGHLPIVHARTHQALSFAECRRTPPAGLTPDTPVFTRDLLEVDIELQSCRLTLFVGHFVATAEGGAEGNGQPASRERRQAEAAATRRIIERRFADPATAEWVVLGDLGEQTSDEQGRADPNSSLAPLLAGGFAHDLLAGAATAPAERWTCHDRASGRYLRRDTMLLSPALARRNREPRLRLIRQGLPYRAERYTGPRLPRIRWNAPAASSHCPIVAELAFTGNPPGS